MTESGSHSDKPRTDERFLSVQVSILRAEDIRFLLPDDLASEMRQFLTIRRNIYQPGDETSNFTGSDIGHLPHLPHMRPVLDCQLIGIFSGDL